MRNQPFLREVIILFVIGVFFGISRYFFESSTFQREVLMDYFIVFTTMAIFLAIFSILRGWKRRF